MQDRHAAPRIRRAVQDLAACAEVEVIIVARGGGSLSDLFAFCDETLCRTVALLRVPVIASIGHHTDRTLLDDVAAVACSTPTHAAEAAVGMDCAQARAALAAQAVRIDVQGRRAVLERARTLQRLSRAPADHLAAHRRRLHQALRELRASARRGVERERGHSARHALVLDRKARAADGLRRGAREPRRLLADLQRARVDAERRRGRDLERLTRALDAHDPQRALERGYAVVSDGAGGVVTTAAAARGAQELDLHFADGLVGARVDEEER